MKYCYHYLAELLDHNNQPVQRMSGLNVSDIRIDCSGYYEDFAELLSKEFGTHKGQKVVITNLSFLHEVQD